jgi:Protein of unknown function (DUF1592)/Protein of unknown function (DUF1588)/Protein of unknown function (DUF1595)/Protein of unknown function (DUF1587)/Protein of unknown function (DUF1585)
MVMQAPGKSPGQSLYWLLFLAGSACTGRLGDPGASTGDPGAGAGSGLPGGAGSGAAGPGAGGGSSTGAGGSTGSGTPAACLASGDTGVRFRVLTRLNRFEYDNTARDLLGDTTHAALSALPADPGDGAFDNNAAALSIDPALAGQYLGLAETLAENALAPNSPGRKLILTCTTTDDACARQIAGDFAARAWRRPLVAGEAERLLALYTATRSAGFSFDQGIQILVEGALSSPNFLFRPEIDPTVDVAAEHPLGPYELATRLSYFLWSSMPDAALESSAASGQLATLTGVASEARRMWADPKAEAFYARFPGLWLHTLDVSIAKDPAPEVFPKFNATLKAAMEGETARYMRDFITGDVNFLDFIDAKWSYVNQSLAQFYGLPGQFSTAFTRVDLSSNAQRGGILTQAAFLTVASAPERTSPVMRGQWVLSRLLATPAPPPPDDVPKIDEQQSTTPQSFRQKMEAHVKNPICAACHNLMDPIGFGLENYDGIGQWRTVDNGMPVDATGKLVSGQTFEGALALESIVKSDARVPGAVVQYLASYALGREVGAGDECLIAPLTAAFQSEDKGRMSALATRVASMDAMRVRRGAP